MIAFFIFDAYSGTHDFSKLDYHKFIEKLETYPNKAKLAYDLWFLSGIRERIKIDWNGPRTLKYFNNQLFVANYFTDNINIIDFRPISNNATKSIQLNENSKIDELCRGEMYFNDASYCFKGLQSCNGCHPVDVEPMD